jgi:hypothetical protein
MFLKTNLDAMLTVELTAGPGENYQDSPVFKEGHGYETVLDS